MTSQPSSPKQRAIQILPWLLVISSVVLWLNSAYTHVLDPVFVGNDIQANPSRNDTPDISNCSTLQPPEAIKKTCTFAFRKQHMRHTCERRPPPKVNAKVTLLKLRKAHRPVTPSLGSVWLDPERKTLGCIIPNVATPSVLDHIRSATDTMQPGRRDLEIIPLKDINGKYASWTKYTIVQHPIQRLFVSYHDVAFTQGLFNNITLEAFMAQLAYGEIYDLMPEWVKYSSWCFPCDVAYEYILKMETLATDMPRFLDAIATRGKKSLPKQNSNNITEEMRRTVSKNRSYNEQLNDFSCKNPAVIDTLLKIYQHDFEMYGYLWNITDLGQCTYQDENNCC